MSIRLASISEVKDFLKGGTTIPQNSEKQNALEIILDDVSDRIQNEIVNSCGFGLLQSTSDGTSGPQEFYGSEHYGHGPRRDKIRLKRFPVASVASLTDSIFNRLYSPNNYVVDPAAAMIYLRIGSFPDAPLAMQVVYTAGYAETGGDQTRKLAVPGYLRSACLVQVAFEYSRREPGNAPIGANTVSRSDGSVVTEGGGLLKEVQRAIVRFKQGSGF
jgi:hypothetical protein